MTWAHTFSRVRYILQRRFKLYYPFDSNFTPRTCQITYVGIAIKYGFLKKLLCYIEFEV